MKNSNKKLKQYVEKLVWQTQLCFSQFSYIFFFTKFRLYWNVRIDKFMQATKDVPDDLWNQQFASFF